MGSVQDQGEQRKRQGVGGEERRGEREFAVARRKVQWCCLWHMRIVYRLSHIAYCVYCLAYRGQGGNHESRRT